MYTTGEGQVKWIKRRDGFMGERAVDVRSLRLRDELLVSRRYRTCTVSGNFGSFSSMPALARLFKSENGYIGAIITGRNEGYVKSGKNFILQKSLVVALDSLSKKPLARLIRGTTIYLSEIDGMKVGLEK
jgi:hypothetical protein